MNTFGGRPAAAGKRAAQKDATGKAVLDAARQEFERVGFEAASLRVIAGLAGVSAGTVLHHYGDKQELLHAALFDDLDRALAQGLRRLGRGTLEEQLAALTRVLFGHYRRRPRLSRTLLRESLFADEPWATRFSGQTTAVHAAIAAQVGQAVARGEVRSDANGPRFALAYLSFFYFALIAWVQGANASPLTLVEGLVHQHLEGLRPLVSTRSKRSSR